MIAFLALLAVLLVQIQILPVFCIKLDLLALVTIYWGLSYGWKRGLTVGLTAGLLQDIFSGGILGLGSVGLAICGILAGCSKAMLFLKYWIVRVCLVFILTALNLGIYLGLSVFLYQKSFLRLFGSQWLAISCGNTIIAAILFWLMDKYE